MNYKKLFDYNIITDIVGQEIKKIDPENLKELESKKATKKKLCGRMKEHEER